MSASAFLIILVVLILFSAFFSASETALTSISKGRVHALLKNKTKGAARLQKLKSNPGRLLATILIGNNFVNVAAASIATVLFTDLYGENGVGIAMGVMTALILIFGEITPKSISIRYSEKLSLLFAPIIILIQYILFPLIWIMEHMVKAQSRMMGNKPAEKSITEDELIALASIGAEEGSIQQQEKELIENVLEFNDIEVQEIMTPRTQIDCLEDTIRIREAAHFMNECGHTKIPVYRETIDNIVGIISVREIMEYVAEKQEDTILRDISLRKPYAIPTSKRINVLLKELQRKRQNMAIVIDDHGGTAGLVTIEDILEEIVGEIIDEHDQEEELIKILDQNTILVQGKTPLYRINEALNIELLMEDYKPVSSLIFKKLKRIPSQGEKFDLENLTFRIEKIVRNRIEQVRIEKHRIKKGGFSKN